MVAIDDVILDTAQIITRDGVHIHEIAGTGIKTLILYSLKAFQCHIQ